VLLSGNHAAIERWRRDRALALTSERRPDLLAVAESEGRMGAADRAQLASRTPSKL
jgi:tRNA (guanine37-N1)-methyltransferase